MIRSLTALAVCIAAALPAAANPPQPGQDTIDATLARTLAEHCIGAIRERLHDPATASLPALPWSGGLPQTVTVSRDKSKLLYIEFDFRARNASNALRLQRAQCSYKPNAKGNYTHAQSRVLPR